MPSSGVVRTVDLAIALPGILLFAPLLLLIALTVRIDAGPGLLHRETRLGHGGHPFLLYKFRTLRRGQPQQPLVAPAGDPRLTRSGHFLRATHLDELPQLFHVVQGVMSLVGPRPTHPELWTAVPHEMRQRALAFRPGMTSPASLDFICEDRVLARLRDPEAAYRDVVFPAKVEADLHYFEQRTSWLADLAVLVRTPLRLASRRHRRACRCRLAALLPREAWSDPGDAVESHQHG